MITLNKNYIYILKTFIFSCILLFLYSIYKTNISNLYFNSLLLVLIFFILTENFLSKENISVFRIITLLAFCFGFFLSCFYIFLSPEDFIGNYNNKIGNFNNIGPNSIIAGGSQTGENVNINISSTVLDKIKICSNVTIGAKSLVNKNVDQSGTYFGVPIKKIK